MTFLEAVNRVLRSDGIIAGDDQELTDFMQSQHENALNLAKIAIQDELSELIAGRFIDPEQSETYITTVDGTREYAMPADFLRLAYEDAFLLEVDAATSTGVSLNNRVFKWRGGEENLRKVILDYKTAPGDPNWYYFTRSSTRNLAMYPVPDANSAGKFYRVEYQKSVRVTVTTDDLPFITAEASDAFVRVASRRFRYLRSSDEVRTQLFPQGIERDPVIQAARAIIIDTEKPIKESTKYGRKYFHA